MLSNLLGPRQFAIIYEPNIRIHCLKPKNYYESNHISGCKTLPKKKKKKKSASFWHILTIETPTSVLAKCANIHNCYSNSAYMRSYCSSSIYYFNIFSLPLHSLFPNSLSPQLIIFATNNPHPYRQ